MLRNSWTQASRPRHPGPTGLIVCCLCTLLADTPATADEHSDTAAKEAYRLQQMELVDQTRKIREDLLTEEISNEWNRIQRDYSRSMSSGARERTPEFKAIESGLRYRIYAATDPENINDPVQMQAVLSNFLRDLDGAGRAVQSRQAKEAFRKEVVEAALPLLKDLLNKSFESRSFAIEVLPQLKVVTPSGNEKRSIVADGVSDVLIGILNDPTQPDAIKTRVASSIAAILDESDPAVGPLVEMAFVKAIKSELESPLKLTPYQLFLVDTLARIRTPREAVGVQQRATAIATLAQVMQDQERDLIVRCRAAGALGQVGFDQQINFEPLAWKTVQLAGETASRYQKNANDRNTKMWEHCGWFLHIAFHPEREADSSKNPHGFLNRAPNSQIVREAWEKILPLTKAMVFGKEVSAKAIEDAHTWVVNSVPNNLRFDERSEPVSQD